jgi:hypothetical protein
LLGGAGVQFLVDEIPSYCPKCGREIKFDAPKHLIPMLEENKREDFNNYVIFICKACRTEYRKMREDDFSA